MALTASQLALCGLIFGLGASSGAIIHKKATGVALKRHHVSTGLKTAPRHMRLPAPKPSLDPTIPLNVLPMPEICQVAVPNISNTQPFLGTEIIGPFTTFSPQIFTPNLTTEGATGVPEPISWSMMVMGFGLIGSSLRKKRKNDYGTC